MIIITGYFLALVLLMNEVICDCGTHSLVVGGDLASIRKFPHSVYLSIDCEHVIFMCSASVLNQKVLLTAAHCIETCITPQGSVTAFAGHERVVESSITRKVYRLQWHGDYDSVSFANDVALLGLKYALPLNNNIKRIMITNNFPKVTQGYLAGWGIVNDETRASTSQLKAVKQIIRSKETCAKTNIRLLGVFCAGSLTDNTNHPSRGDSGSAFIVNKFHEIGILSQRPYRYPALMFYTNVSYYYTWIMKASKEVLCF